MDNLVYNEQLVGSSDGTYQKNILGRTFIENDQIKTVLLVTVNGTVILSTSDVNLAREKYNSITKTQIEFRLKDL